MAAGTRSRPRGGASLFLLTYLRSSSRAALTPLCSCRPGSGFKLAFAHAPQNLTINVGSAHSTPPITVGARFGDVGEWVTLNLTAGANAIPLTSVGLIDPAKATYPLVLDVVTQFEGGNARLELESIQVDTVRTSRPWLCTTD
jgi:hypothetical protein